MGRSDLLNKVQTQNYFEPCNFEGKAAKEILGDMEYKIFFTFFFFGGGGRGGGGGGYKANFRGIREHIPLLG